MRSCGDKGKGLDFIKSGDAWICLIGFPSVGKNTLLNKLTNTFSEVQEIEFTSIDIYQGSFDIVGISWNKLQLLDFQVLSKEPKMEKDKEDKL